MAKKIQLIVGSTRQNRVADDVLTWLVPQLQTRTDMELEVVDLKEESLPFFDAPISPLYMPDESEAGKRWGEKIGSADGYIFLTPEYNRSIPASLKNAIDFLAAEWNEKPATIMSYGWIDGGQSAARHLTEILQWLHVEVAEPQVHIKFESDMVDESRKIIDAPNALRAYNDTLAQSLDTLLA